MARKTLKNVIDELSSIHIGIGKERGYFVENLSLLTSSGMDVGHALEAILHQTRSKEMRGIIEKLHRDVEAGSPLWRSLERARIFPEHVVSLLRIGEESGKLAENLKVVASQEEKERVFRSQLQAALLYPSFILTFTIAVGLGIAWFILPNLTSVFTSLNVDLPLITRALLFVGNLLAKQGIVIVPAAIFSLIVLFYVLFFYSGTRFIGRNLLCYLPGIGGLIKELEIGRFAYLLGTLLQAGIPVTDALGSLERATGFPYYQHLYHQLQQFLDEGESFKRSFISIPRSSFLIPGPVQQLVVAGEESGNLAETLVKISKAYAEKTETTTKNLATVLEPVLLVLVWLGVLIVALAVIMPIYGLVGSINQKGF